MRAVLHRHGSGRRVLKAYTATVAHLVTGPGWSSAEVETDRLDPWDRPNSRDWLELSLPNGDLQFFGRVTESPLSLVRRDDALLESETPKLVAHGFLDSNLDVHTSPARQYRVGSLYPTDQWISNAVLPYVNTIDDALVGRALEPFAKAVASVRVPDSACKGAPSLGDLIRVAFDDRTARELGLPAGIEPVQGISVNGVRSLLRSQSKMNELLVGTFQPSSLIEMTPLLVRQSSVSGPSLLGHVPVIRLRMAPFRTRALRDAVVSPDAAFSSQPGPTMSVGSAGVFDPGLFEIVTWKASEARVAYPVSVACSTAFDNDVTAATAWIASLAGGNSLGVAEALKLPVMNEEDVRTHGLRMQQSVWPFLPRLEAQSSASAGDYLGFIARLAGTLYQFHAPGYLFESGVAVLPSLDFTWRPGELMKVQVRGRWLVAYVHGVQHRVTSDEDGLVSGMTTLQFSRGLWDERLRDVAVPLELDPRVPESTPKKVQDTQKCQAGVPAKFPWTIETHTFDNTSAELARWAVDRGFPAAAFLHPTPFETREAQSVAAACAYVIERYWRQVYPDARISILDGYRKDPPNLPQNHTLGCAFDFAIRKNDGSSSTVGVFQTWTALTRLSQDGRIPTGGRGLYVNVSTPETTGFACPGVTGTAPEKAGYASKRNLGFPRGGSDGVHYDFRGYFGALHVKGRGGNTLIGESAANTWIATDRDGDGRDEYQLGTVDPARIWENIPDSNLAAEIKAYFYSKGKSDDTLPEVGPGVPNVLQVLGITPSCFSEIP